MSEAVSVTCDAPDCEINQGPHPEPRPFRGWLRVVAREPNEPVVFDFCGWECAMRYAATLEPPEVIA